MEWGLDSLCMQHQVNINRKLKQSLMDIVVVIYGQSLEKMKFYLCLYPFSYSFLFSLLPLQHILRRPVQHVFVAS